MTGPFTPVLKLFFFVVSMLSSYQRREYFRAMKRFFSPLTEAQMQSVKKAKREAKHSFQPRRIALGRGKYRLAEQGELGGSRYQIYSTSMEDLSSFGSHICGYFLHLKGLVALCLFLTVINLPSAMYFDSDEYGGPKTSTLGVHYFATRGSAVCESVIGEYVDPATNITSVTYSNDHCPYRNKMGILGMIVVSGVAVFVVIMRLSLKRTMVKLDESQQTAQDYSVVVEDPDEDAVDPNEWYSYFSQFGEVAAITVAINNGQWQSVEAACAPALHQTNGAVRGTSGDRPFLRAHADGRVPASLAEERAESYQCLQSAQLGRCWTTPRPLDPRIQG